MEEEELDEARGRAGFMEEEELDEARGRAGFMEEEELDEARGRAGFTEEEELDEEEADGAKKTLTCGLPAPPMPPPAAAAASWALAVVTWAAVRGPCSFVWPVFLLFQCDRMDLTFL